MMDESFMVFVGDHILSCYMWLTVDDFKGGKIDFKVFFHKNQLHLI